MDFSELNRAAPVLFEQEVDSTNLRIRDMALRGAAEGTILFAEAQTAGRGRMGRSFLSPPGGLYVSMLLHASEEPARDLTLTPGVAVAVSRAIERVSGISCGIKWPNDLILQNKKLCGILVESFMVGARRELVVGIGVNVNTERFPPSLVTAISLYQATGERCALEPLARALTEELDAFIAAWRADSACVLNDYRRLCLNLGRTVRLSDGRIGTAVDVDPEFRLLVRFPDGGEEAVSYGEVSVRGLYGYV